MQSAGSLQNGVLLLCSLDLPPDFDSPTSRRIHKTMELKPFSLQQLCTMAAHFLISKAPEVKWPSDVDEIVRDVLHRQEATACHTIDAMQTLIRQRLTVAKDRTATHKNEWKAFLRVLFDESLQEDHEALCRRSPQKQEDLFGTNHLRHRSKPQG